MENLLPQKKCAARSNKIIIFILNNIYLKLAPNQEERNEDGISYKLKIRRYKFIIKQHLENCLETLI